MRRYVYRVMKIHLLKLTGAHMVDLGATLSTWFTRGYREVLDGRLGRQIVTI